MKRRSPAQLDADIAQALAGRGLTKIQRAALADMAAHGGTIDGGDQFGFRGRVLHSPFMLFTSGKTYRMDTYRALEQAGLVTRTQHVVRLSPAGRAYLAASQGQP